MVCKANSGNTTGECPENNISQANSSFKLNTENTNSQANTSYSNRKNTKVAQLIVAATTADTANNQTISQADMDESLRYKRCLDYGLGVFAIDTHPSNDKVERLVSGPRALATVSDPNIFFLIDTGSPINVINESTYESLASKVTLDLCNTQFFGYASISPLKVTGQFTAAITYKDKSIKAGFIVIKGYEQCLMSHNTAIDLGIIMVDSIETPIHDQAKFWSVKATAGKVTPPIGHAEILSKKYANPFGEELGVIKDVKIKLVIDETVKPVKRARGAESFTKKLGKALRLAKANNQNKNELLKVFLRRYRETSHRAPDVAPSLLFMRRKRGSDISRLVQRLGKLHIFSKANKVFATATFQLEYDRCMHPIICIVSDSLVQTKLKLKRKSTPILDPDPYRVTNLNVTQLSTMHHSKSATRYSSISVVDKVQYNEGENIGPCCNY